VNTYPNPVSCPYLSGLAPATEHDILPQGRAPEDLVARVSERVEEEIGAQSIAPIAETNEPVTENGELFLSVGLHDPGC
jgi:hypothetical protein